jgi:hypothetical protein
VFSAGQTASFNLMLDNGKAPYGLTIVWGDGDISTLAITSNGGLTISHTYNSGSDSSGFIIKIDASDSAGTTSSVQLSALVRSKSQLVALTTTTQSPVSRILSDIKKDAVIIWPTYLVSVVAVFSFWLGEMKELHEIVVLKKNPGKLRYRH